MVTKNKLKAYANYIIIFIGILLVVSLARNISKSQESLKTIAKKEKEREVLADRNKQLKENLSKVRSEAFIEKQIRDQLGLAREGEIVLVLPDDEVLKKLVPDMPKEEEELPDPVWRKWVKLFL